MTDRVDRLLYSVTEAAEVLGVGRSKLYELMAAGELRTVTVGRRRLVPADALDEFVTRLASRVERRPG